MASSAKSADVVAPSSSPAVDAPLGDDVVFLLGSPRSGTTWLQELLSSHPDVVSSQELHLFPKYLAHLDQEWSRQSARLQETVAAILRQDLPNDRFFGLPTVFTAGEFDDVLREVAKTAFAAVRRTKPEARIVVEKTPGNSLCVPLILRLFPGARFIHLIRDPHDVVASLFGASADWGGPWAPTTVRSASRMWLRHYEGACQAVASRHYQQIRYEDLRQKGPGVLSQAFATCGLTVGVDAARSILFTVNSALERDLQAMPGITIGGEAAERLGAATPREPRGFRRDGVLPRRSLSPLERWQVQEELGEILSSLCYLDENAWSGTPLWARMLYRGQRQAATSLRSVSQTARREAKPLKKLAAALRM